MGRDGIIVHHSNLLHHGSNCVNHVALLHTYTWFMDFMERALELAESVAGALAPRPPVGAVVVSDDGETVVGEGATQPNPGPHAEAVALDQAKRNARGGTMYCTLEPHQHEGTTPPCTEAIINAGIKHVVCPIADPNPLVAGRGFERLNAAGVDVVTQVEGSLTRRAVELVEGFEKHLNTGFPFVTTKWAMSLDGKIATRYRDSRWITGEVARAHAHGLRYRSDAVMTGIGTMLADDPRLTARDPRTGKRMGNRPYLRVVVDSHARMPKDALLLRESGEVMQVVAVDTSSEDSHTVMKFSDPLGESVDLVALFRYLGERGCHNILIEAGEMLNGALFDLKLVDKVVAYIATDKIIGGSSALSPVGGQGSGLMAESARLHDTRIEHLGDDIAFIGYIDYA